MAGGRLEDQDMSQVVVLFSSVLLLTFAAPVSAVPVVVCGGFALGGDGEVGLCVRVEIVHL